MKDDKFNKLMEQYVDSTKRGQETDLLKLKGREEKQRGRQRNPILVWATCAIILTMVISLSIALPIVLNKENEPEVLYCDVLNIDKTVVEEFSELNDKYKFNCMLPSISFIDEPYIYLMSEKSKEEKFGAFIEVSVFDEHFDGITFNVIKKPYELNQLQYFKFFTDKTEWGEIAVVYKIGDDDYDGYYNYDIAFSIDNYNYFITFQSYSIMTATQVLDYIYNC